MYNLGQHTRDLQLRATAHLSTGSSQRIHDGQLPLAVTMHAGQQTLPGVIRNVLHNNVALQLSRH